MMYYNSYKFYVVVVIGDGKGGWELVLMFCFGDYLNGVLIFFCDLVVLFDGLIKLWVMVDKVS